MKARFKKSAIAMAVAAFAVSGASLADAISGQTNVTEDFNKSSDLVINNKNTEFKSKVDFLETDRLNTTTNRVQNNTQNHELNENLSTTTTTSDTRSDSEKNALTYNEKINVDAQANADVGLRFDADVDLHRDFSRTYADEQAITNENVSKDWDENKDVNVNLTDVEMTKKLSLTKDIRIDGDVAISGDIAVDSASVAVVEDKQYNSHNEGDNFVLKNEASVGDNVLEGASGNIGLNMFAGDNNQQDNAAALSATDAGFVFGMIDAEVFVKQYATDNTTSNVGVQNLASIGGGAMANATGNIAVNVVSGNSNLQKNNLAASVGQGAVAEASVNTQQHSHGNYTTNTYTEAVVNGTPGGVSGHIEMVPVTLTAAPGQIFGSESTKPNGLTGGYQGDEVGEFQGSINGTPFNGTYEGNHDGSLSAENLEQLTLGSTLTAEVPVWVLDSCGGCEGGLQTIATKNSATLADNALVNASGRIGVNIAAGSGNIQSNSLSMAVIPTPPVTP